jgi:small subunit ribosomal protein S2
MKEEKDYMATVHVDIKKLLEAGAHFGHKTSRWHPKMAPYIHSKRGGSHIIDLTKTVSALEIALQFVEEQVASGKQILIVGTKRQSREVARKLAADTNMPYVVERWLGGLLTNQKTISGRVKHLKDLEAKMESGELTAKYNKLEIQRFQEEIDAMNFKFGGIKDMAARPGAVLVFDMVHDANAVLETKRLGAPVIAIADTNADPTKADYPIPANDDAIKALELIGEYFRQAIEAGQNKRKGHTDKTEAPAKAEPAKTEAPKAEPAAEPAKTEPKA